MATLNVADLNRQGKVFVGANVSAKSVIAVNATMTGLMLYNPINSGKKLVLVDAGFVWTTTPAAVHNVGIGIVAATATAPTSLTVAGGPARAADGSGLAGSGIVYDAAVFAAAPVAARWFLNATYQAASAAGTTVASAMQLDRLDGSIALVPGSAACLIAVTTTAVGMGSFTWVEYPI